MPGWEVKKSGRIYLLEDPEDLVRLASIGQIRPGDEVRRVGRKRWKKAGDLEAVAAVLNADPWAAWDSLGGTRPKDLWTQCARLIEDAPQEESDASQVVGQPATSEEENSQVEAPKDLAAPVAPTEDTAPRPIPPPTRTSRPPSSTEAQEEPGTPHPSPPPRDERPLGPGEVSSPPPHGELIAFPGGGSQLGAAAAMRLESLESLESLEVPAASRPARTPPTRRAFPWVFGTIAFVGILMMMMIQFHVRSAAMWVSPQLPVATEPKAVPVSEKSTDEKREEPILMVEQESPNALREATEALRERLSTGVIDMKGRPDDLSTALLVELSRMGLGPVKVQADVLAWGGARNDMPEFAEIHVLLQSNGELEWELGAVGLVVGKYAQTYALEVERLTVSLQGEDGTLRRIEIDPEMARQFYRNRIDLFGYLQGL